MHTIRISITAALLLCAAGLFHATDASAKQCAFNKGGYVMKVQWYRQAHLGTYYNAYKHDTMGTLYALAPPVQTDTLALGQGSCTTTSETLSLVASYASGPLGFDNGYVQKGTPVALFANSSRGGKIYLDRNGFETSTPNMVPTQCSHATRDGHCWTKNTDNIPFSPEGYRWFLVTQPSTTQYIDFWGSVFDIQWGPGGPIN